MPKDFPLPRPMSAQETTIAILQQQLHGENQRRLSDIEETLREVRANTAILPALKSDVDAVKNRMDDQQKEIDDCVASQNRVKGIGLGITGVFSAWEILKQFIGKHP